MRAREYEMRQRRIAEGCCPRCGREISGGLAIFTVGVLSGWMRRRADVCSPKGWATCIRQWDNILKAEAAIKVSK